MSMSCVNAGDISYRMAQDYTSLFTFIAIKMLTSGLSIHEKVIDYATYASRVTVSRS